MSTVEFGFNPVVWLEALFKRITDSVSGRGGVEAFCQYLDQIDFIPELAPLRQRMKANSIWFETALAKCTKEMLKRPEAMREEEIFNFMGVRCTQCGAETTLWVMSVQKKCGCGGKYAVLYTTVLKELLQRRLKISPEAIMMNCAYDKLADAYVDAFHALRLVMQHTAQQFGWAAFRIEDPQLRNYLDQYFLGRLAGEQKIPREEKETLQFIVRANLANVEPEKAEQLIKLAMQVVKWGYLYEVLGCVGASTLYNSALTEYSMLYDSLNRQIRESLAVGDSEKHTSIHIRKTLGGYYAPCLLMPKSAWETGKIPNEIMLEPVYRLPVFPKQDFGAMQTVYSRIGGGKTFLLSALTSYAVTKHELVFSPLGDKSNSLSLACIPLFAYDKRTQALLHNLTEALGVEPQGIPVITLNVLRRNEKIVDAEKNPPTICDRILVVDNPKSFHVDFKLVLNELKAVAEGFGYSKPVGLVTVRNLDRFDPAANVNIDVQVAINLLTEFDGWRKSHLSQPTRVLIDEISYLAPSQVTLYAGDALRSGATISDFIKESRRNRLSIDVATQLPLEVLPEIRAAATNVFFRDLAASKDKARSQIDFLLESMQLKDPNIRIVVRDINNKGLLPKGCWFWYHQPTRDIHVVKPCPPTFCLQDPHLTPRQLFKLYEKQSGKKLLLDSWRDVKVLEATSRSKEQTRWDI